MQDFESPATGEDAGASASDRRRALRESLVIAVATSIAACAGIVGLWIAASATIRDDYRHYLTSVARAAALQVDPGLHRQLTTPAQRNGPEYQRAVEPLRQLRRALPDMRYIYTMVPDGGQIRFVLDAAMPGDEDGDGIDDQAGLWEVYEDRDPAMLAALGDGQTPGVSMATDRPYGDKWGSFMTGWAPLIDEAGEQFGILGIDVDAGLFVAHMARARFWAVAGLAPAALLIVVLAVGFYRIRVRGLAAAQAAARAAQVLTVEQERLRNVIEGTNVGTWESRLDPASSGDGIICVDTRWAAMLGRRASELNPMPADSFWPMLLHPDDAEKSRTALSEALREPGRLFEMDVRMRHATGHWVWTEVRGKVIERDVQGRPLRMVGTQMDVSARKAVELALVESESNFRSLFEMSPVGIVLADEATGRFLMVNDALLASTGYSRDEMLALTYHDITPAYWHDFERRELKVLERGTHFGTYEKEYQRKDGSRYPVLISGMRMKDKAGRNVLWAIVQDISERKAMESQLADAAARDRLTGLANRSQFMERLQIAVDRVRDGRQQRFAVLFLDFDRFKLVNDALGHETGDGLLREIAARLRDTLQGGSERHGPAENVIARFGGDEFLVLLNHLSETAEAERIAESLLNSLSRTYKVNGRDVYSTASIGIVTSEQCLESADAVVRNADVAMYEAKRSGRACAVMFDDVMRARLTRYVTVDSGLRKALGTSQLSLVYQPIVDLETRAMTSVEALTRWHHPELGHVPPSEFIPVAEESGLIVTLGQWALREACRTLATWRARDPLNAPQSVCINISRAELALGDRLLVRVREALAESGLPSECLRLEVTERDVMRDPGATLKLMRALRAMGVHLAMDDFGTGTSSLGCLRDYPFDVIKIDRSFISDVAVNQDVLAMIHAALTLVQNLGKTSVAEGVETDHQVAILQALGCHFGQGYFFSRPLTAEQMPGFMSRSDPTRVT